MSYQKVRKALLEKVRQRMPLHQERLTWSRDKIIEFQTNQLRCLLQKITQHSQYYKQRCENINIANVSLNDLVHILPSTKQDVMAAWDDIICVDDITRSIAENHLLRFRQEKISNPFYKNFHYITATGGSSGTRGLFVWDLNYFAEVACVAFRYQYRDEKKIPIKGETKVAVLTSPTLIHASTPLFSIVIDPSAQVEHLPVDQPLPELCMKLDKLQPTHLIGYSSVIAELAQQALLDNLSIKPQRVSTNSEPLDQEARDHVREAWGIEVNNMWGSVEMGMAGIESDQHAGLMLSEDTLIIEPVDEKLKPVTDPKAARKLIITNLFNYVFPLVRYVVDDTVEITETTCSSYRIAKDIGGRSDDWFTYHDNLHIHPMVFRHVLGQEPSITEYQVEQTQKGAIIRIVTNVKIDASTLQHQLITSLIAAGLLSPEIKIKVVKEIPRHEETGKLKRFIPFTY